MEPSTAPGATVSPSFARMSPRVPLAGALTSRVTLSVSSSRTGSSALTASPGFLNQRPIVASETDSPRVGTRISVAMIVLSLLGRRCPWKRKGASQPSGREGLVEESLQLGLVLRHQARGGGGGGGAAHVAGTIHLGACGLENPFEIRLDE